jgi:DNA-binding NtrC family response regulator
MRKMKLLLVDDEEEYIRTMAERLAMRDVSSQVALSGEDALRAVADEVPDVMVLDLRMPGIDGMEVLERVRREHPHVQVIILTGHGSEREERAARRLGAFEYLEKPADTQELVKTIRAAWKTALKLLKEGEEGFSRHMEAAAMAEAGVPDMALERLGRPSVAPVGLKVLFVDDEEDFVRTMAERMQMRDLGGDVALSGAQALAMVEEEQPDVMVLDLRMPGMDGMEVLRRVKREHPEVEVVVLTGHGSVQDEAEARRLGAFDYLQKPVDMAVLMETVRKAGRAGRSARSGADPNA